MKTIMISFYLFMLSCSMPNISTGFREHFYLVLEVHEEGGVESQVLDCIHNVAIIKEFIVDPLPIENTVRMRFCLEGDMAQTTRRLERELNGQHNIISYQIRRSY